MTAHDSNLDFAAALEAQAPFLSRLARSLIADEHAAADAVQETMLSAWKAGSTPRAAQTATMSRGPAGLETGRLRAWLVSALRRKSVSRLRSAAYHHERQATEGPATAGESKRASTGDLPADTASAPERVAARLERQALLHQAIQALPEVYRTAIVLRFQDSMSAAEIANELGLPVATVRSRIQRGLQNLRSELDRHGEASGEADPRARWLAALTPLAFPETKSLAVAPSTATAGVAGIIGVVVMKKLVLVGLAALAATGATWLYRASSEGVSPSTEFTAAAAKASADVLVPVEADLSSRQEASPARREELPSLTAQSERAAPQLAPKVATITGRAMLMDGTVLSGIKVSARRDLTLGAAPIASTLTDESGAFTLRLEPGESADPVTVLVSSELDIPDGAAKENVKLGAANLEFRIDAMVVRVFPDDLSQLSSEARGTAQDALLRVDFTDPDSVTGGFLPFKYHTSTEKTACRILRPGLEYVFTASLGEFGADEWTAVVPAGLRSGVYEFPLKKRHQALAAYTAHLTGEALGEGQRLWVALMQEKDAEGVEVDGKAHGSTSFKGSDTTVVKENCLPGTSFVSTNITSRGDPSDLYVTNQYQNVQLAADENTEFTINLARGGRFSVLVVRADGEKPEAPLQGMLSYTYVRGGPPGEIGSLNTIGQLKKFGKKGRWGMAPFVELGELLLCDDAIHPGTIEVELDCSGYESSKGTLEIVAGEVAAWEVEL